MELVYYVVIFSIFLVSFPLSSRKLAYAADPRLPGYSPLNSMSFKGRRGIMWGAVAIAAVLIVVCVFRPQTLPDIKMYELMYDMGGAEKVNRDIEPTFGWLTRISPTFLTLLAIYAILSVGTHISAILWNSPNIWLSLIIYLSYTFVVHDLIQMRASVAIGIMLIAVRFIREHKWYYYFPCVLVAYLFHYSAIIFILFYFLPARRLNKWIWSAVLIVCLIAGFVNTHLGYVAKYVPLKIVENYLEHYMGNRTFVASGIGFVRVFKVLCAIAMLFFQKDIVKRYPLAIPVMIFFMCSQISYLLLADIPVLQGRFGEMFAAFEIFALAMFPFISKKHYYILWIVPIVIAIYENMEAFTLLTSDIR